MRISIIHTKRAFRVNSKDLPKILKNRAQRIARRLDPSNIKAQSEPVMNGANIRYEMSNRTGAIGSGGVGAIHVMAEQLGLVREINERLHLLKVHLPYYESEHVRTVAYNIIARGVRLEDLELRRQDENFLNAFGAHWQEFAFNAARLAESRTK